MAVVLILFAATAIRRSELAVFLADEARGSLRNKRVHVGIVGQDGPTGRNAPQHAYIRQLLDSKIVVTCNPESEGDARLPEALAAGSLVLADKPADPPPALRDGHNVVHYPSLAALLDLLHRHLNATAEADAIARAGAASIQSSEQLIDGLIDTVLGAGRSARVHFPEPAAEQRRNEWLFVLDGIQRSARATLEPAASGADMVLMDLLRVRNTGGAALISRLLAGYPARLPVAALDWTDFPTRLIAPEATRPPGRHSRIDFYFKRSRAIRPGRADEPPYFPPLAATVHPLYYPAKTPFLAALRNVSAATGWGASRPRSERAFDVSCFFPPIRKRELRRKAWELRQKTPEWQTKPPLECVGHGRMGNALDALLSCMVFANATGRRGTWSASTATKRLVVLPNGLLSPLGRPHPRSRECVAPHVRNCRGAVTNASGTVEVPRAATRIESCTAFAPAGMRRAEFFARYAAMASRVVLKGHTRTPRNCVAVHLRMGTGIDRSHHATERRFNFSAVIFAGAIARHQRGGGDVFVASDDRRPISAARLNEHAWFRQARKHTGNDIIADHEQLADCHTIITYGFSTFGFTAAILGKANYVILQPRTSTDQGPDAKHALYSYPKMSWEDSL